MYAGVRVKGQIKALQESSMPRTAVIAILGSMCLMLGATVEAQSAATQAQNPPANPSASTPSSAAPSSDRSNSSSSKPTSGRKDTSRAAKEQQSQKQKCPKNGDTSNVNCQARGQTPQ
jgi:hypothetical protein